MRVNVTLVLVVFALGFVAARRRVRSTTATLATTNPSASPVGRQFSFDGQPEEFETSWNHFDIQKLKAKAWAKNDTGNRITLGKQYPGLPSNPGDSNELPNPISPPVQQPPPYKPPPGCLGKRGQYASPTSCASYLNCWDDVVIEQICPAGLLFNDIAGYCDFEYNVKCGDRQPATPKPPLPAGSKLCPDPNGRYRSSTNCSEFFVCATGKPIKFSCPPSLVYSDILNVCDYQHNVDCRGTATPKPLHPTQPQPTQPPQPSSTYVPTKPPTYPSKPPTNPPQPPTYQPQPPTYQPQPPTYQPQPPTHPPQSSTHSPQPSTHPSQPPTYQPQPPIYQPQPPSYQPQPPTYSPQPPTYAPQPPNPPKPPTYQPQPYPPLPSAYSANPWLKVKTDSWQDLGTQLEIDKEIEKQESADSPALDNQSTHNAIETSTLTNPWTLHQVIPPELMITPCNNGDVHKLNDACTSVIVCKNNKPQVVACSKGFTYDKPSDSCKPFSIAKC
ncbi:extensin-like [Pogonomyrmex barbatus]|uniref:Extensin-like n=1 Tax=Pogonomyrmex barbatus TaxID=144034 RepID=A0A6I9WWG2_9HYME|nr:extensin-like [Pogonomyrmex barbatus]